ncbi:MAG: hypothetical protein M1836_004746 [Candelina mexicana]|nr:MAG: hypothetical protein M1836_004746 [Candelina mexicana]
MTAKSLNDTITVATFSRRYYGDSRTTERQEALPDLSVSAFQTNTRPVDLYTVLGTHAPQKNRIIYRHTSTCTPLDFSRFVDIDFENKTDPISYLLQKINFGAANPNNYTFQYETKAAQDGIRYELSYVKVPTVPEVSPPVPELGRPDADIAAFLLIPNGVSFQNNGKKVTKYPSDGYVNTLGCIDRDQYGKPNKASPKGGKVWCTPLKPQYYAFDEAMKIGFNKCQEVTVKRLRDYLSVQGIHSSIAGSGASALRGMETLNDLQQGPPPNHQWQLKVNS